MSAPDEVGKNLVSAASPVEGRDRTTVQIQRTVQRLAQLQARRALAEMRRVAQARARARKRDARRHQELGAAIESAGFSDWPGVDVMGLLLVARDHFGEAETARKLMRDRARQASQHVPTR